MTPARTLLLVVLCAAASGSGASAASYQKIDGSIVDPIQLLMRFGGDHPYSGVNLEPGADLTEAELSFAALRNAT
jgi:hypothetical protein